MSYLDVFDVHLPIYDHLIAPGDIVAVGQNQHPQFEVMATRGDKAWVRDIASGMDGIVPAARCRIITLAADCGARPQA
jgi:hypothetical protein